MENSYEVKLGQLQNEGKEVTLWNLWYLGVQLIQDGEAMRHTMDREREMGS